MKIMLQFLFYLQDALKQGFPLKLGFFVTFEYITKRSYALLLVYKAFFFFCNKKKHFFSNINKKTKNATCKVGFMEKQDLVGPGHLICFFSLDLFFGKKFRFVFFLKVQIQFVIYMIKELKNVCTKFFLKKKVCFVTAIHFSFFFERCNPFS